MKKVLGMILIPFALFAFEVSFSKKFEKEIATDKLSTSISVVVNKGSEAEVSPQLEKFNDFIRSNNTVEKRAGSFSIRPKRKYEKGHSTLIGYTGNLRYTIYATESKAINKFLKSFLKLKKHEDTSVTVSGLRWIVSEEKKTQTIESLRLEAILWAESYAQKLSTETNKNCKVSKININTQSFRPSYQALRSEVMMDSSVTKSNIPVPEVTKNRISLKPSYVMECK